MCLKIEPLIKIVSIDVNKSVNIDIVKEDTFFVALKYFHSQQKLSRFFLQKNSFIFRSDLIKIIGTHLNYGKDEYRQFGRKIFLQNLIISENKLLRFFKRIEPADIDTEVIFCTLSRVNSDIEASKSLK